MKKDVELVIRARDEASRSGAAIADVLDRLAKVSRDAGTSAKEGATGIDLLGVALGQVQKEYRTIDKAADAASAAFERQTRALSETREQQQALSVQVGAAKAALERLRAEEISDVEAKKAQAVQIKQVETAYNALIRQQEAVSKAADRQEVALNAAGLALQQVGSQATAAEMSVVEAALRRSAQAAKDYAAASQDAAAKGVDGFFGIGRSAKDAGESARVIDAALKEEARMVAVVEEHLQRAAAAVRDKTAALEAQKLKYTELAQKAREAQAAEDADQANNALLGVRGPTKSAAESAAAIEAALKEEARLVSVVEMSLQAARKEEDARTQAVIRQQEEYRKLAQAARESQLAIENNSANDAFFGVGRMPAKSAADSYSVFAEAAQKQDEQRASAARLRAELNPLQQVQAEYNRKVAEAQSLQAAGAISAKELAAQLRRLKVDAQAAGDALSNRGGRGEANKNTLFGLKPYELQNLSYQINDVLTQLGSGTAPTQVLAQQGGQIAQIFAGSRGGSFFSTIAQGAKAAGPLVAVLAVTLGTVVSALKNIADLSKSTKLFNGQLGASADGGIYDAKVLAETSHELDVLAGSLKEARSQVSILAREGVAPAWIQDMAITSRNLSEVWGTDLVEATKEVSKGFTGQFKEIDELDKKYNFLTKAQRDHIRELFEQGKAEEARLHAFKIFKGLMDDGAASMRGPWKEALQSLSQAWDNFLKWIGNSRPIQAMIGWLKDLAKWADNATSALLKAQNRNEIARVEARIADLEEERTVAQARTGQGGMPRGRALTRNAGTVRLDVAAIDKDLAASRAEKSKLEGQRAKDVRAPGTQQAAKDEDRKTEAGANRAARDAAKAAREAEAAERERESAAETLSRSLSALEARVGKLSTAPLEDRLAAVDKEYARIKRELDEAREKGVTTVDGLTLKDYEARVDAAKVLLRQQAEMTYYSEAIKDLEDQRSARLKTIQDQLAQGAITQEQAFAAFDEIENDVAPAMANIADDALIFARALYAAKPSPELAAFISKMELVDKKERSPGGVGSAGQVSKLATIQESERRVNELLAQRADLIALATAEYERGNLTFEDFEARVQNAYDRTSLALMEQINSIDVMLGQMKSLGEISQTAYDAWIAKTQMLRHELDNTSNQILSVADANQMIVDAGVSAWDQFFSAIEEGRDVLGSFLDAMRQMLSDIFRDIAKVIVRAMIMRALMKTGIGKMISGATEGLFDAEGATQAAVALGGAGALWMQVVAGLQAAAAQLQAAGGMGGLAGGASGGGGKKGFLSSVFSFAASVFSPVKAPIKHSGGLVGAAGVQRMAPVAAFANAVRYHGGGLPGLRANEVAAILEKNEEVITASDPRHALNGGKSGGGGGSTKIVNVLDSPDLLTHALSDERGQRVMVNFVRQNPGAFKAAMGLV